MMRTTVSTQPQIIIVVCCITLRRSAYDAWGNYSVHDADGKKNTSPTFIGHINPLRYRGYYYDRETRLYYLQSRYYDFANCRFINADTFATTDANGFLSANMFAYCENNPIMRTDEDGEVAHVIVGAVLGALIGGGIQMFNNVVAGRPLAENIGTALFTGAASGALAASGATLVMSVVGNAAISMAGNAINQLHDKKHPFDVGDMLLDGVIGGISGAVGGSGMTKTVKLKTLNNNLKKKVLSGSFRAARKGMRYYVSQTRSLYRNFLFKPMRNSGIVSFLLSRPKSAYSRFR